MILDIQRQTVGFAWFWIDTTHSIKSVILRRNRSHPTTSELTDCCPTAWFIVDLLLIYCWFIVELLLIYCWFTVDLLLIMLIYCWFIVDLLLRVNSQSTATVISGRNTSHQGTSKFQSLNRLAGVIVDIWFKHDFIHKKKKKEEKKIFTIQNECDHQQE